MLFLQDNERIMFTSTLAEEKNELALVCVALLGCIVGLLCGVMGIVALKNNKRKKGKAAKLNAALSGENVGAVGDNKFTSADYQVIDFYIDMWSGGVRLKICCQKVVITGLGILFSTRRATVIDVS